MADMKKYNEIYFCFMLESSPSIFFQTLANPVEGQTLGTHPSGDPYWIGSNAHPQMPSEADASSVQDKRKCPYCPYTSAHSSHLRGHIRRHTGERPFVCSYCGRSFTYKQHLTEHTRLHTGERPFACSVCGKAFTKSSHKKIHEIKCAQRVT